MILLHFILRNECKPLGYIQEATEIKDLVTLEPKVCVVGAVWLHVSKGARLMKRKVSLILNASKWEL